ncbi:hypothetical protein [Catenulispora rubra]|uniref:hypothetical protein n=1 Tax=Catenulispora rubra TaxID=280293 RepID=UPI001892557B|nr:hypothetical protein [Catenulispora rubra]
MADPTATPPTNPPMAPPSAVLIARIGGTAAELAAAAISAHTLYHLGGQLNLGPFTAWLLPAALDAYAFTALAVGYSLPANHPGQKPVLRNARLAFAMTLGCNALDHVLQKVGDLIDPTARDLLLAAVATLPPLVVERLLNLQSLLADHRSARADQLPTESPSLLDQAGGVDSETSPDQVAQPHKRPDWTSLGCEVFAELADRLGRRPSGRQFQAALALHVEDLIAADRLPSGTRAPSLSSVKRVRAAIESYVADHQRHAAETDTGEDENAKKREL